MKISHNSGLVLTFVSAILFSGCGGGGGSTAATPSELELMQTQMNSVAALFATGMPTQAAVTAKLTSSFLMDGMDAASYAKQLTTVPAPMASSDKFTLTLSTLFDNANQSNAVADTKWANATQLNAAGAVLGESRVKFVNVAGTWLMAGNERAVRVSLRAESGMTTSPATFSSDVNFAVDPTTASLANVSAVVVTGPSVVPSTGVTVYSNATPATPATAVLNAQLQLCNGTIVTNCTNAIDGSVYTLTLKDSAGNVIAIYKDALSKAPLPASSLTTAMFPTIGSISPATISGVTPGAALSINWTTPAGLVSDWVDFTVWDSNGAMVFQQSGLPTGNSFSATMPNFTPPASGVAMARFDVAVQAVDGFGRQYVVFK